MFPSPSGAGFRTRSLTFFWRAQLRPSTDRPVSGKGRKSLTHSYSFAGQAHLWGKRNMYYWKLYRETEPFPFLLTNNIFIGQVK